MCACVGCDTHARARTRTHTEQRIQLRSAAHPGLSNILSAQPKNHNWTLWEALIQSTVTMLSETKSTACSQHINSQLTLSLYLSISISLSSGLRCTNFPSSVFTATPVLSPNPAPVVLRCVIELLKPSFLPQILYCNYLLSSDYVKMNENEQKNPKTLIN